MKAASWGLVVAVMAATASAPAAANPSVRVELLSGAAEQGELVELLPETVVLQDAGETQLRVPLVDVLAIGFRDTSTARPVPTIQVELTDGSQLRSQDFLVEQQVAKLVWRDGKPFSLPTRQVRSVRFGEVATATDEQWEEIRRSEHEGDTLVLRKKNDALDFLEGVVGDVTEDEVSFRLDQTTRQVNRGKLEGFLVYQPHKVELPDPAATVIDSAGGRWQAQEIVTTDEGLRIKLSGGGQHTLPWKSTARIDYGAAKILYLSDLKPVRESWTPFIQATVAEAASARLFRPRQNRSLDGGELSLYYASSKKTVTYARGLAVQSRTEIEYQLPNNFRRLQAIAGINARMRRHGDVRLQVLAEGRSILDVPIRGGDEPTQLDLEIDGARRIGLVVDYGDNLDIADHLNLCNLRVIR